MKNLIWQKAILIIIAFVTPSCIDSKKFGGGGGGFRGSSGARANPAPAGGGFGGGHPAGGGGMAGQPHWGGGGAPAGGFHGGGVPGSNFRPPSGGGPGHFGGGSGMGSASRGSAFKTALAGAALGTVGGLVAFEAGKAIIHSFDRPFQYEGRNYYWGDEYVKRRPGEIQCNMPFEKLIQSPAPAPATQSPSVNGTVNGTNQEQLLAQATFPNGTRPKQIVWTCKANEICCGTDCCPNPQYSQSQSKADGNSVIGTIGKVLLGILVVGVLLCCCCALIAYKFCRSAFDSFMPSNDSKYDAATPVAGQYPQQTQSYPMQPYPSSGNTYPAQPQPPNVYPPAPASYPPAPGYYENKY